MPGQPSFMNKLIQRLNGTPERAGASATDPGLVFRTFAETVETVAATAIAGGPKVRLPLPAHPFAGGDR